MDNKDITAGTVLYLPVWVKGQDSRQGTPTLPRGTAR